MINYSKYNIFSKIRDSENHFIVNLLTGNADILNKDETEQLQSLISRKDISDVDFRNELAEKGYLSEEAEEKKLYRTRYLDFLDSRSKDEIQLFFVTNYSCNFACTYCYQDQYSNPEKQLNNDIIDSFFTYVKREFAGRNKYITVFGGEPLLNSPRQKASIKYLLEKSSEASLDISFVTNGYNLESYMDIFRNRNITFSKIVKGIDACLENKITINLRMVIDKENIENLPDLARFAIDKGWTKSPYFKTQIGRNYELHHCQSSPDKLFSRVSLYETIYDLSKQHPHILEFYNPAYSVAKFLSENGSLPDALFDSCPACKTEWAFDYTGQIYSCTATVGKSNESLGSFYPSVTKKNEMIDQWESRDVTSIPECKECNLQLACGGGCGSVAKNNSGSVCSPDCRPITELLELGFSEYFENGKNRSEFTNQIIDYQK